MKRRNIVFLVMAAIVVIAAPSAIAELQELNQGVQRGSGLSQWHHYTHLAASGATQNVQQEPAANCEGGTASGFRCERVDLLGHLTPSDLGLTLINDIWGWTDSADGTDYAIIGGMEGTVFVDISDPRSPVAKGFLPAETLDPDNEFWRDMKVYDDHAFIVSEQRGHGMQVFDLTQLADVTMADAPVTFAATVLYGGDYSNSVSNTHNIGINEDSGFAYLVGTTSCGTGGDGVTTVESNGGLHMVDISDPSNPTFAGCAGEQGYVHDVQCVIYDGPDADYTGREICFNSTAVEASGPLTSRLNTLSIADVTDKGNPVVLSNTEYDNAGYSHQGWLTEDQAFFLHGDELDELFGTVGETTTRIWDVSDLDAPTLVNAEGLGTHTIDHNMYIEGRYLSQANYTAGLRVQDLVNVADGALTEVAYFDMFPEDDERAPSDGVVVEDFNGAWSNFPYLDQTGLVAVSSIDRGLFVLRVMVADAGGPYEVDSGGTVTLDASGSMDSDADDVIFEWDLDGDGEYDDGTGVTVDFTPSESGTDIDVSVQISYDGSSDVDNATVTVGPGDTGPTDPPTDPPTEPGPDEPTVTILGETENAAETSIIYSQLAFPLGGADVVLIGRDDLFADSLASGGGQGILNAPLLLTETEGLNAAVATEIERLGAQRAIILGGEEAVSAQVETDLADVVDTVDRVQGPSRLETAVDLATEITSDTSTSTVVLARAYPSESSGDPTQAFADSLASGAWAAEDQVPVLLTQTDVLSTPTSAWLDANDITDVVVIGGVDAISADVVTALEALEITVTRVEGPNRAGTATAIAAARGATTAADAERTILVDGAAEFGWTDAFPAALYASQELRPIVLASGDIVPPETAAYLQDGNTSLLCGVHTGTVACSAAAALLGIG